MGRPRKLESIHDLDKAPVNKSKNWSNISRICDMNTSPFQLNAVLLFVGFHDTACNMKLLIPLRSAPCFIAVRNTD